MAITRRQFCLKLGSGVAASVFVPRLIKSSWTKPATDSKPYLREARYYTPLADRKVRCLLCPRTCLVADGKRGYCRVRENQKGSYKTLVYGRLCSINNDPIEKKPLFHFLPGTMALSVATAGCNLKCKFCQNWNISQVAPEDIPFEYYSPERLVNLAQQIQSPTIAFTYTEPTISTEYILDTAKLARSKGIHSVMISNGYINSEPLSDLCQVLSAIKIDFKAFSDDFYRNVTDGTLQPVLDTMIQIKKNNVWLEIVNLVIPTQNDAPAQFRQMSQWILQNLGSDIPVHFTRFHPLYLMENLPPTPLRTLESAYEIARECGLRFVYVGNVPGHAAENTYCPHCNRKIIERIGYQIRTFAIKNGKCQYCQTNIPGFWS
ncbi:MAG TPA: AmmeMemoRadiSam system radical SAM enzyme [Candidatus Marinimicrobia bacterium]|nr:AmmeMemoRadiSam system radical SAM enzyme [Candidatus Neomarinimicrobiota bacterium]